jgi:adenylosuccinate synthase
MENSMSMQVVVGVNWGDAGKGRLVDYFAQAADIVARYQERHSTRP